MDKIKIIPISTVGLTAAPNANGSISKSNVDNSDIFNSFLRFL
jgi:hypothetical protein